LTFEEDLLRTENMTYNHDSWSLDSRNSVLGNIFPVSSDSFWTNAVDHSSSDTGPITTGCALLSKERWQWYNKSLYTTGHYDGVEQWERKFLDFW